MNGGGLWVAAASLKRSFKVKTSRKACKLAVLAAAAPLFALAGIVCLASPSLADGTVTVGSQPAPVHRIVIWDGTTAKAGASWTNPTSSTFQPETGDGHSGNTALEFKFQGSNIWLGAGWDWFTWKTGKDVGTDTSAMKNLTFWIKSKGTTGDLQIQLLCNGDVIDTPDHHTVKVNVLKYCPQMMDGKWHEAIIPLADLTHNAGYDPKVVTMLDFGFMAGNDTDGSFLIDDIAFDDANA